MNNLGPDTWQLSPAHSPLAGEFDPPGDRLVTQLALFAGALSVGALHIKDALESEDTVATRRVLAHLGITFTTDSDGWLVVSRQQGRLQRPEVDLDCGNSWHCLALATGLLAGQKCPALLTGGAELARYDFGPLAEYLNQMGAEVECLGGGRFLPIRIKGQPLYPLEAELPPERCQFKDPLLLAALHGVGTTRLSCTLPQPDHLERLLRFMGVRTGRDNSTISLAGEQKLQPRRIKVPGDFTAAAPFIITALLLPGSELTINQVGANPRRAGLLKLLARLAGSLERERDWQFGTEPVTSIRVRHQPQLQRFNIAPNLSPQLLGEFPLLALLATQCQGTSHLKGAAHLRKRTPDRLQLTAQVLREFGADIEIDPDGFTVRGPTPLHSAEVQCAGDFRVVLMAACAALLADGPSVIHGAGIIEQVYPGMLDALQAAAN